MQEHRGGKSTGSLPGGGDMGVSFLPFSRGASSTETYQKFQIL